MPLCRAWQYYHCAAITDGAITSFSDVARHERNQFDAKVRRLTRRAKRNDEYT